MICRSKTSFLLIFFSNLAPPIRQDNSSASNIIVAVSPSVGQRKRPRSNRLKYSQNPSPSHSRILMRFLFLLQNTYSASENGSREKLSWTSVMRPLIDLLISVYPQHMYIGLLPHLITRTSTYGIYLSIAQNLYLGLQ